MAFEVSCIPRGGIHDRGERRSEVLIAQALKAGHRSTIHEQYDCHRAFSTVRVEAVLASTRNNAQLPLMLLKVGPILPTRPTNATIDKMDKVWPYLVGFVPNRVTAIDGPGRGHSGGTLMAAYILEAIDDVIRL